MDIVYLLGKGSKVDNWELRMSLRSVWKYLIGGAEESAPESPKSPEGSLPADERVDLSTPATGDFQIYIVGERPDWLDVNHPMIRWVPAKDPHRVSKDSNLIQKLLLFSMERDAPERFMFFSDDQGLLRAPGDVSELETPYHGGEIPAPHPADNEWLKRLKATGKWLRNQGFPAKHFDTHVPQPMETRELRRFLDTDFGASKFTVCSLYFNLTRTEGAKIDDTNIRAGLYGEGLMPGEIVEKTQGLGNLFYSIDGNSVKNFWLVRMFEDVLFPEPAPWEKPAPVKLFPKVDVEKEVAAANMILSAPDVFL